MPRTPKPFDKILQTRIKLDLYTKYGDAALQGQSAADFIADVNECYGHLMAFRNIINGMVSFNEAPEKAVLPYLSVDEEN